MRGRDRPAGKPRNRAATRNAAHADLPMSEKRVLARGESQIAGEHELASGAAGPPPNRCDGHYWSARQTDKDVNPG